MNAATGLGTGDRAALRVAERSWTYAELSVLIARAGHRLAGHGVGHGDRVLLAVPTSAEFVVAYHAVLAVGAVAVTVNPGCTAQELDYFLDDAGCALAVGQPGTAGAVTEAAAARGIPVWLLDDVLESSGDLLDAVPCRPDEVAVLLYTSGTTGHPKGAELTHGNLTACTTAVISALGLTDTERVGTALPLFHVYGQIVVMGSTLRAGGTLTLQTRFDPAELLRTAARHRLTMIAGVPTMWTDLLHSTTDPGPGGIGLRIALSGGAPLPGEVRQAIRARFGAELLEGYGLSEATGVATMCVPGGPRPPGTVGRALPCVEVRVVGADDDALPPGEVGEIAVRGPILMRGYRHRPEETARAVRNGWLHTGDLGRQDEDGFLWVVGRKKDLVIRGGYNVYPREVEEVLYQHPAVREAAVIGVPDERLGEEVAAVLALHPGTAVGPDELRGWLAERLAAYKTPRIFHVVAELPKGTTGKILKRAIDPDDVLALGMRTARRP